jgi:hypothetical protein
MPTSLGRDRPACETVGFFQLALSVTVGRDRHIGTTVSTENTGGLIVTPKALRLFCASARH